MRWPWSNRSRAKSVPGDKTGGWESLRGILSHPSFLGGRGVGWGTGVVGHPYPPPSIDQLEALYEEHPAVFGCAEILSRNAARPRVEVGRWVQEDTDAARRWVPTHHYVEEILDTPNPSQSRIKLLHYIVSRRVVSGYSYVWKVRGGDGNVSQLWSIPSSWVRPVRSNTMGLLWDKYVVKKMGVTIPHTDMILISGVSIRDNASSVSPSFASYRDIRLDNDRHLYQAEMLSNVKVPGTYVEVEGMLTAEQKLSLKEDLDATLGKGRRGSTVVFEGGAKPGVSNPLVDLDWPGLTGSSESRICMAFGVPPILLHARVGLDNATYSNYEQARRSLYRDTLAPMWDSLDDELTRGLLRSEGEYGLCIRTRYDELPEFKSDIDTAVDRSIKLKNAGIATVNEARVASGMVSHPDPLMDELPVPSVPGAPPQDSTPGATSDSAKVVTV